jgi:hypothetical protein
MIGRTRWRKNRRATAQVELALQPISQKDLKGTIGECDLALFDIFLVPMLHPVDKGRQSIAREIEFGKTTDRFVRHPDYHSKQAHTPKPVVGSCTTWSCIQTA